MRSKKRSPVSEELKNRLAEYLRLHLKAQEDLPAHQPSPQSEALGHCSAAPDQQEAEAVPLQQALYVHLCEISPKEDDPRTAHGRSDHVLSGSSPANVPLAELQQRLKQKGPTFAHLLIEACEKRSLTDAQLYKKAQVSRATFNKVIHGRSVPGKPIACALVLALEPDLAQARLLLQAAGIHLSDNNEFDMIICFCLENGIFDIDTVNELLYERDQLLIGSVAR